MQSFLEGILGGRFQKSGVTLWGHYWGPGAEKWDHFMGSLLGARGRKVGSIHWCITGGQGPKSGINLWGHYLGPGAEKWEQVYDTSR